MTAPDEVAVVPVLTEEALALYPVIPIEDGSEGDVDEYETAVDDDEVEESAGTEVAEESPEDEPTSESLGG